jgi:F-type H+-transporting ATPase subunit b
LANATTAAPTPGPPSDFFAHHLVGKEGFALTVLKRLFPAALLVLVLAPAALASEGAAHESALTTALRVVNFIIFVGIIYKFAGKKIAEAFGGRRKQIETQLSDLEARKKDAEQKLAEVERGIANIDAEREKILADCVAQGEALKAGIIESAHKAAERIKEQARLTAANERKAALKNVRAEVDDLVAAAAEKALASRLSAEDHDKLINDSLTKVVLN